MTIVDAIIQQKRRAEALDALERANENLYEAELQGLGSGIARLAVLRARVRQAERNLAECHY